jgi:hypothetical protein
MRQFAQTLFRVMAPAFVNTLKSKNTTFTAQKLVLGTGLTAYGMWFCSNKIFNS